MNQQIDLKQAVKNVLKKGWALLAFVVLTAAAAQIISANFIPKIYQAETTMFIGQEQGSSQNLTLSDMEASSQLIVDYKELANSHRVIDPVMSSLNIKMDFGDFKKALKLDVLDTSRLFSVAFSSEDPVLAYNVANAMAVQLVSVAGEVVKVENIQIVDRATIPAEPVSPDVNMITVLAAVIALVVGLLFIYLHELFSDAFTSQEMVENELQLDVVAIIPHFKEEKSNYHKGLVTITEPNSYLSESFKMLRTNINYMTKEDGNKVIMLTSSVGSEGKTTTSCNLAITMAQEHKKVLLIDGDLRRPNLFKTFKINMLPGLSDIIYGKYALAEAIQHAIDVPGLDILTAGRMTSMTTELLSSVAFKRVIDEAREKYDYILIDAPPVLNVSDTVIISRIVDKVLFVVAMESTNRSLVKEAKRSLDKVSVKLMGMILTNMRINPKNYYYGGTETRRKSRR
ncbi:polysaccharide biosynthesis tyrosine autokinase [Oscillospiraceae bacterium CM]|nr:polysaccharide biosynthesis tyrosine autokinase [Oscillospiraceae bacterium CM]